MEIIKDFLMKMSASLAAVKMYPVTHPQFRKVMSVAYDSLVAILKERQQFIIGIIDNEIIFEKEVLFDLNIMLEQFIKYATEKGIEKIYIQKGVGEEEFACFIALLIEKKEGQDDIKTALAAKNVQHIQVGALLTSAEKREKGSIGCDVIYGNCVKELPGFFEKMLNGRSEDGHAYGELRSVIARLRANLLGRYYEFLHLPEKAKGDRIHWHCLNVSLLAMSFSTALGFEGEHVRDIGAAGLLHDIGRIYLGLIMKQKSYSDKKDIYSGFVNHCYLGAKLLLEHSPDLGALPVIVAFEHHMRSTDKGGRMAVYPVQHIASQIVGICDFYDTITQRRDAQHDYPPDFIYRVMMAKDRELFPQPLLEKFFQFLGVWPNGAIVKLSSDEVAIVRGQNADIFSPSVEILGSQEQPALIRLTGAKGDKRIVKALNPFSEGRPYLHDI